MQNIHQMPDYCKRTPNAMKIANETNAKKPSYTIKKTPKFPFISPIQSGLFHLSLEFAGDIGCTWT